jgi:hypothetical protein
MCSADQRNRAGNIIYRGVCACGQRAVLAYYLQSAYVRADQRAFWHMIFHMFIYLHIHIYLQGVKYCACRPAMPMLAMLGTLQCMNGERHRAPSVGMTAQMGAWAA